MTRTLLTITRIIVAILFIFSGLVKANDPLGLSYKMQEFFDLWHVNFLNDYSLAFSIIIIGFEIIAGVALLIGWQMRLMSWLLLLLIIFFTFLTGFAYFSGKFKNCGCFGDCIPITPLTSFLKDILLLLLIGFLFYHREKIRPAFAKPVNLAFILLATVFSFGLQWYVLAYLPVVDCLPFKKQNNISEQMKIPANAIQDSFAINFVYAKNGKQFSFAPSELPADLETYTFVERKDKLVRKGNAEPPLKGFSLNTMSDADSTNAVLLQPGYSLLLFVSDYDNTQKLTKLQGTALEKTLQAATARNIPVYIVTNTPSPIQLQANAAGWPYTVFKTDFTAFRTAARNNPELYLLKQGTVINKWPEPHADKALTTIQHL